MARIAGTLLAVALLLAADLASKRWAAGPLRSAPPRVTAGGHLVLRYAENHGIVFGLLREQGAGRQPLFAAYSATVAAALAAVLLARLLRGSPGAASTAGVAAMLGGALGNLHCRLERGFVVDFLDVRLPGGLRWPAFNLADLFMAAGLALALVGLLQRARAGRRAARVPRPRAAVG